MNKRILRDIRVNKGISLETFADAVGISVDYARELENNPSELSKVNYPTFKKIADAVEVDVDGIQLN